jgi:hypothetical protein
LLCTYKSFSKRRTFLCGGKGMEALRSISRRVLAAPIVLSDVSTSDFSELFLGHDTEGDLQGSIWPRKGPGEIGRGQKQRREREKIP